MKNLSLDLPSGKLIGLVGPDGVGKSTLLSLIAGARKIQNGSLYVLGGDMKSKEHRNKVCPLIAYMPQGLGKNLYFTLTVEEKFKQLGTTLLSTGGLLLANFSQIKKSYDLAFFFVFI